MHDLAVFLHVAEVFVQLLLAIYILPFLVLFGEGLLRFMPGPTEGPFALIANMLNKDILKGPEASRCFHIVHNAHSPNWQHLHYGPSLHNFLLVHLGLWHIDLPHDVSPASLVAEEGCEVHKLGRVILGEALLPVVPAAALPRQVAQGLMPGVENFL